MNSSIPPAWTLWATWLLCIDGTTSHIPTDVGNGALVGAGLHQWFGVVLRTEENLRFNELRSAEPGSARTAEGGCPHVVRGFFANVTLWDCIKGVGAKRATQSWPKDPLNQFRLMNLLVPDLRIGNLEMQQILFALLPAKHPMWSALNGHFSRRFC